MSAQPPVPTSQTLNPLLCKVAVQLWEVESPLLSEQAESCTASKIHKKLDRAGILKICSGIFIIILPHYHITESIIVSYGMV